MDVLPDCIPCFFNQLNNLARLSGMSNEELFSAFKTLAAKIASMDPERPFRAPELGRFLYKDVVDGTGVVDPYRELKARTNSILVDSFHEVRESFERRVAAGEDRLRSALIFAAVGNAIDYGAYETIDVDAVMKTVDGADLVLDEVEGLRSHLETAKNILVMGDNVGETFFDVILIEAIKEIAPPGAVVYYNVRSRPVINDVTRADAVIAGLDRVAVITEHGDLPGILLEEELRDPDFRRLWYGSDVVISKGQGNFESLDDVTDRPTYFVLKTKCKAVADIIGIEKEKFAVFSAESYRSTKIKRRRSREE